MIDLEMSLNAIPGGAERLANAFGIQIGGPYIAEFEKAQMAIMAEARRLFGNEGKIYVACGDHDNIRGEFPFAFRNSILLEERIPMFFFLSRKGREQNLCTLNTKLWWKEPVFRNPEMHCYVGRQELLNRVTEELRRLAKNPTTANSLWRTVDGKKEERLWVTSFHVYLGFAHPSASVNNVGTPFLSEIV